jgi:hypothetical protein
MSTTKKTVKKAQMGNALGYNAKTSPLANKAKKGKYEKKLDTIGSGTSRSVRMIDGKGKVMGQERLGSSGASKLANTYNREKSMTNSSRAENSSFLESREKTGKSASSRTVKASSAIASMKNGGKMKKPAKKLMCGGTMSKKKK